MKLLSKIEELEKVEIPKRLNAHLYMHPLDLEKDVDLPHEFEEFNPVIQRMLMLSPIERGTAWITIDCKSVKKGETHRRGGPHVDGNYVYAWNGGGGNGWKTGDAGRVLSPEDHADQYCNAKGGMIIASSYAACKAWIGEFDVMPNQGGDCSHIRNLLDKMKNLILKPNIFYLGNSTCIHESLPIEEDVDRVLVRLTLPATQEVFV